MIPTLLFDQADAQTASDNWNLNCGPAALAAILGKRLEDVRPACEVVQFGTRGYMNSSMMAQAIRYLRGSFKETRLPLDRRIACDEDYLPSHGLARIQFSGPWIINGKPARWAATHTHWVASWKIPNAGGERCIVFDINGGLMDYARWDQEILPLIMQSIKRCDGEWFVTNSWEVAKS